MSTRQQPEVRAWCERKRKQDEEDGAPEMPGMPQRYLEAEAALEFGLDLERFYRAAVVWRCEMMAHVIIKRQREGYIQERQMDWLREKTKREKGKGSNPRDRHLAAWGKPEWML